MDSRWSPLNQDDKREVAVLLHPTASFLDILNGVSTDAVDLSAYASAVKHTSKDADVTFDYHTALNGAAQPQPGQLLELQLSGQTLWVGVIDTISSYTLQPGKHSLALKAYTRDNMPAWKDVKFVTDLYVTGTPLNTIAEDVAGQVGLAAEEIALPVIGVYVVHSNVQLANLAGWEMLQQLLLSSGYEPAIDARGRLTAISRDLGRASDVVLTEDRIIAITGSKSRSPVTSVRIKWLDPNLTMVSQQDQVLANATITAGFFQLHQHQEIYFSADKTQRASGTYLVVKQSANSGLLPVCTESYTVISPTEGSLDLVTAFWAPALATTALAGLIASSYIPDGVASFGAGVTIPEGRLVEMVSQVAILLIMMSIGTGVYEIRGTPYSYVNGRNTTEAAAAGVPDWLLQIQEIDNDFVMSEPDAQAFAARELIYAARSAETYKSTIVDDPRIERGDIVELYDGSRIYVTDYARTLTSGSPAVLELTGFRA